MGIPDIGWVHDDDFSIQITADSFFYRLFTYVRFYKLLQAPRNIIFPLSKNFKPKKMSQSLLEREAKFVKALKATTGRDLQEWFSIIETSELDERHAIRDWLQEEHGLDYMPAHKLSHLHRENRRLHGPKVSFSATGLSGYAIYMSKTSRFKMAWEMGTGDIIAILEAPSMERWEAETNIPLAKRESVLHFIGRNIVLQETSGSGSYEIRGNAIYIKGIEDIKNQNEGLIEKKNSETYQQFLDSMKIGFEQWHDGTGYDLDALGQLEAEEKASIEKLLIENLLREGDWRDVNALVALGTPSAWKAVDQARFHIKTKVRDYALSVIISNMDSKEATKEYIAELEQQVIESVKNGNYEMAEKMPSLPVKKALLYSVLEHSDDVVRVNAAAFLMYLCGQASEPFDWDQRPFFLRFNERNPWERKKIWEELRERTGL